jgi:hypothetical protein
MDFSAHASDRRQLRQLPSSVAVSAADLLIPGGDGDGDEQPVEGRGPSIHLRVDRQLPGRARAA